ncbi:TIR domain-containing protein [Synechococcus sp. 1G10]|uniref:nSTAND1 domain-containing NTPase n=1 Tax=Synechococcus sp. 1G10 TaxID=2025605 RepID=UPI000B990541|nr:TIR domain-containing protein [Synechococcus sp. 1G10]
MVRVFLSHSSLDNASAGRIKAWLEQQGFEAPFLDFDKHAGIPPGADWERTLYREIEQSQALLILQSANWSNSKWCFAEFTQARALGKPIFQVIEATDGDPGPTIAPALQVLDLRREREAGLEQLKKQLAAIALTAQGGFPWDGTRPPYPGLLVFEEEDAAIYFGRVEEIRHLIERLTARRTLGGARLLVLLGASGSGKSSLVRAGVLPRLRRSGRGWLVVPPFRPQSQPCQELARALALAAGRSVDWRDLHRSLQEGARLGTLPVVLAEIAGDLHMAAAANEAQILLLIDQGEELFGGLDPEEACRFFRILTAAMGGDLPFLAVMTLRSEFLGRLQAAEKDGLTARFEEVSLAPLAMAQIPTIIKGPAKVAGLDVEEAFVQQAAADAETEDALPLLAFALREIYERYRVDRHLSLADYQTLGDAKAGLSPLENAVRRRADEVLAAMKPSEKQKRALRDAFVPAMVRFEQGNYVRRPARWDALPLEAQPLLEQFVNARLLISRQEEMGNRLLEVAHEALLRKWPLLRGWLDEDREFLIGSQQLEQDHQDWKMASEQERPTALLSGLKLQRAKAWLSERPQQLSDELSSFVQASSDQAEAQERKARRNRRRVMGGLSGLTVLAVAGGSIAWWREGEARAAEYATRAEVLLNTDPLGSMVNALAALGKQTQEEAFTTSQTLAVATGRNNQIGSIPTGQGQVLSLIDLKNGELISGGDDGSLRRWRNGKALGAAIPTGQGKVRSLIELQIGELISGGDDGSLRRWRNGKSLGAAIPTGQGKVRSLIELQIGELISGGDDGSLRRWRDGKPLGAAIPTGQGQVWSLIELQNGELISGGRDGSLRRWRDGKPLGAAIPTGQGQVWSLIELQNGELISGGRDGSLRRWRDGKPLGAAIPTGQGQVLILIELQNGELISGGRDGSLRRWRDGKPLGVAIPTGQGEVWSLIELQNGELISGGTDGSLRRWRGDGQAVGAAIPTGQVQVLKLIELKNGELISAGHEGSLRRWRDGKPLGDAIPTGQGQVWSLIELKNGELISGGTDGSLRRWRDGKPLGAAIPTGQGKVWSLIELQNGELISGGDDGSLRRWRDGKPLGAAIPTGQGQVWSLIELQNGELISGGFDGSLRRWRDGKPLGAAIPTGQGEVWSLIELQNGELISGGHDGSLRRWRDGKPLGAPIPTGQGALWSLIELKNGELISGGFDGSLRRWRDGKPLGAAILTGQGPVWSLIELKNGELFSGGGNGSLRSYLIPEAAIGEACKELHEHPVLLSPKTPPEQAARQTCFNYRFLKG